MSTDKILLDSHKEFVDYILEFYGKEGLYELEPPATRKEVQDALCIRVQHTETYHFKADSIDRELIRDIMLTRRGSSEEILVPEVTEWVKNATKT